MKKDLHLIYRAVLFFIIYSLFHITPSFAQTNTIIEAGNSYVDISKKTSGGFIQVGDTLEIRTNYFWASSYNSGAGANTLYSVRYYDSVPIKTTMLTGTQDSLRLITNEGLTYKRYTLATGDDAASYTAAPGTGKYQIRFNIGATPTVPTGTPGLLTDTLGSSKIKIGTYKPVLFGGTLLTTSFRVVVSGNPGDTIILGSGKLVYRKTMYGADTIITATPYKILISSSTSSTLCGNALSNNLAGEKGGTFDTGSVMNRSYALSFPIPAYSYVQQSRAVSVGDGSFAIVNNSSPLGSTNNDSSRYAPNCTNPTTVNPLDSCTNRMFGGFWDIIGDHTGTNNSTGNPPAKPGTKGGYMLEVNADVVTTQAYDQTISGLCPNTYYEFSAWVRNLCKNCGEDSSSAQTYKPGVLPTLSFAVNGIDIYCSGTLDTVGWQQKGFVFQTGAGETSATFSIRNNASGGGGNDWVLDDIALGTCGPTSSLNYNPYLLGCSTGVLASLSDTVKYTYNPNYSFFRWQESTNGGSTWINTTDSGSMSPTYSGGYYKYITNYPPFMAYGADSGTLYRVVVASSYSNLSSTSCSFTDGNSILLKIVNCGNLVDVSLVSFKGELSADNKTTLTWDVVSESNMNVYEIERSDDGKTFTEIGEVDAKNLSGLSSYDFEDPEAVNGNIYYRLKMVDNKGLYKYSNLIVVSKFLNFNVRSLQNPFTDLISADIILPADGVTTLYLYDAYGRLLQTKSQSMFRGLNNAIMGDLNYLSSGIYTLSVEYNHQFIQKKLIKAH